MGARFFASPIRKSSKSFHSGTRRLVVHSLPSCYDPEDRCLQRCTRDERVEIELRGLLLGGIVLIGASIGLG